MKITSSQLVASAKSVKQKNSSNFVLTDELVKCSIILTMPIKNLVRVVLGTLGLLLIPFVLQLTIGTGVDGQGFNWKPGDFVVVGTLVFITGLGLDFAWRRAKHRGLAVIAIILAFLALYVHMAVGIVNTWPLAGS